MEKEKRKKALLVVSPLFKHWFINFSNGKMYKAP